VWWWWTLVVVGWPGVLAVSCLSSRNVWRTLRVSSLWMDGGEVQVVAYVPPSVCVATARECIPSVAQGEAGRGRDQNYKGEGGMTWYVNSTQLPNRLCSLQSDTGFGLPLRRRSRPYLYIYVETSLKKMGQRTALASRRQTSGGRCEPHSSRSAGRSTVQRGGRTGGEQREGAAGASMNVNMIHLYLSGRGGAAGGAEDKCDEEKGDGVPLHGSR
jgi:hypothetical protein